MKQKKEMGKLILGISLFVLVAAGLLFAYQSFGPKSKQNDTKGNASKELSAEVPNSTNDQEANKASSTEDSTSDQETGNEPFTDNTDSGNDQEATKKVLIEVVIPDQETQEFTLSTKADTLRQALDEENLIQGSDSEYGFYITGVTGRIADDNNQEWWCITKGGEEIFYGVNDIMIEDGDKYELTLMIGY